MKEHEPGIAICVKAPRSLFDRLNEVAARLERSRSWVMIRAMERGLKELETIAGGGRE